MEQYEENRMMKEPKLELFDLEGLINNLNSSLADSDQVIQLREFLPKQPKKNPFLYRLMDRELEARGKYQLFLPFEIAILHPFNPKGKIGYIFIETGYTDANSNYSRRYETLRLRIKHPLKLKNGEIIPNCSVKFLQEMEEWEKPYQERKDHLRCGGLIWTKTDLSKALPSDWFLTQKNI